MKLFFFSMFMDMRRSAPFDKIYLLYDTTKRGEMQGENSRGAGWGGIKVLLQAKPTFQSSGGAEPLHYGCCRLVRCDFSGLAVLSTAKRGGTTEYKMPIWLYSPLTVGVYSSKSAKTSPEIEKSLIWGGEFDIIMSMSGSRTAKAAWNVINIIKIHTDGR